MSAFDICTAIADKIKTELTQQNKGTKYFHDIYDNVHTRSFLISEVPSYPAITVTPGPEGFEYQPSGVRWTTQLFYIRAYYKDEYDSERQMQLLIRDLKKVVDTPEKLQYTISNPDGSEETRFVTVDKLDGVTTDEGVLRPVAIGELSIFLKYVEDGRIF